MQFFTQMTNIRILDIKSLLNAKKGQYNLWPNHVIEDALNLTCNAFKMGKKKRGEKRNGLKKRAIKEKS